MCAHVEGMGMMARDAGGLSSIEMSSFASIVQEVTGCDAGSMKRPEGG